MVAVGDTQSDGRALVITLADTLAEMKAVTIGDARGYTQALLDTLAGTLADVDAVNDKRGDAHALVDTA